MSYFIERDPEEPCLIDKAIFMHLERMPFNPKKAAHVMLLRGRSNKEVSNMTGLGEPVVSGIASALGIRSA